jgi:DnaK suppressor protein
MKIDQAVSAAELTAFKRRLTSVLARLASSYCDATRERDPAPASDAADQSAVDWETNLMLNRLEWMSLLTRQVSEALERIDTSSYGLCLRCGQRIAVKRLTALPWAAFCMTCQEVQV